MVEFLCLRTNYGRIFFSLFSVFVRKVLFWSFLGFWGFVFVCCFGILSVGWA